MLALTVESAHRQLKRLFKKFIKVSEISYMATHTPEEVTYSEVIDDRDLSRFINSGSPTDAPSISKRSYSTLNTFLISVIVVLSVMCCVFIGLFITEKAENSNKVLNGSSSSGKNSASDFCVESASNELVCATKAATPHFRHLYVCSLS